MKFSTFLFPLLVLLFVIPKEANAQLLRKIKNRVTNTVEDAILDKTEEKARQKTDEALDEMLDEKQEKKKKKAKKKDRNENQDSADASADDHMDAEESKAASDFMAAVLNRSEASYKPSYAFHSEVHMTYSDAKGKKENKMQLSLGEQCLLIEMEDEESMMIQDFENKSMVNLDQQKKTGQAISLDFLSGLSTPIDTDDDDEVSFAKTGRTKQVLGYHCEEYKLETEDGHMEIWMTDEAPVKNTDFMEGMSSMLKNDNFMPPGMTGLAMESYGYEKNELEYIMKVTHVKVKGRTIDLAEYSIQKM